MAVTAPPRTEERGRRREALLAALDEDQRSAVAATPGPLLVVAGAGSGKTRALTHRAAWAAVEWGLAPSGVLVIAFTNKAVDEMAERLRALVGHEWVGGTRGMVVRTCHAAAWQLCVRPHRFALDRPVQTILSNDEALAVVRRAIKEEGLDLSPKTTLGRISWAKAHTLSPADLAEHSRGDRAVAEVWVRYRDELRATWAVDFEDLILIAVDLLERDAEARRRVTGPYAMLLVDEYQDISPAQHRWVELMCCEHQNVTVVGDDDQAVHGYRGGDARVMLEFDRAFPGTRRVELRLNYRSGAVILEAAARLVAHNEARFHKELRAVRPGGERSFHRFDDQAEEGEATATWVLSELARGREPRELVVLARTHSYTWAVEEAVRQAGVAYRVVGRRRLHEHAEVADVLAALRLLVNPQHREALVRLVKRLPGVAKGTLEAVVGTAREREMSPLELLEDPVQVGALPAGFRKRAARLHALLDLESVREALRRGGLAAAVRASEVVSGWQAELAGARDAEAMARVERLAALRVLAERFEREEGRDLEEFLGCVVLRSENEEGPGELAISTIHAAKGLEWGAVCVVGAVEGELPHRRALSGGGSVCEERRCAYVAFTRAKDVLRVSAALRSRRDGGELVPSRFVREAGLR